MSLEFRVEGQAELRRLAAQIKASADKGLGREFAKALKSASEPIETSIRKSYKGLPASGGYEATFSKSLRFRLAQRTAATTASLKLTTFADATKERRDIGRLEKGELRHPVFGRSRAGKRKGERIANPWAVTRVAGLFHRRGTDSAVREVADRIDKVVAEYAHRLIN